MIITIDTNDPGRGAELLVRLLHQERGAIDALLATLERLGADSPVAKREAATRRARKAQKKTPGRRGPGRRKVSARASGSGAAAPARPDADELEAWRRKAMAPALKHPKNSNERAEAIYDLSRVELQPPGAEAAKCYSTASIRNWINAVEGDDG